MITLCAWHRETPGLACDPSHELADDHTNDGRVSHGICEAHAEYMRDKLRAVDGRHTTP